jgi:hypothetical protein
MRDRFDHFLVKKAIEKGVAILEGERVVRVEKCQSIHGPDGIIDTGGQNPDGSWITDICPCHGTGEIRTPVSRDELVEWAIKMIKYLNEDKELKYIAVYHKDGSRLEISNEN